VPDIYKKEELPTRHPVVQAIAVSPLLVFPPLLGMMLADTNCYDYCDRDVSVLAANSTVVVAFQKSRRISL
jgi:hypothetical protein